MSSATEASNQKPRRRTTGLITQQAGAETLVYDEQSHHAFCLSASAAAVWARCDGTVSPAEIAASVALTLGAPIDKETVLFALQQLASDGLMEASEEPGIVSRRALVSRLGKGALVMLPVIAMVAAPTAAQAYNGCFDCV